MKVDLRKQIKKEMARRKISTPAMARRIECHPQTLYDYFSGKRALTADYLQCLLVELNGKIEFDDD